LGHTEDLKNDTCSLSILVFGIDGWMQENISRAVLPLTQHQCSIHCENSHVAQSASKGKWVAPTTHDHDTQKSSGV